MFDSLTFSTCEHSVSILVWQQILVSHFVSIVWRILIFLAQGGGCVIIGEDNF